MAELLYQRDVYGKTLVEIGKAYPEVVVLDADLSSSTRTKIFAQAYPDRFFNFGVAEQNMMATAAGLASCNKIVFASTFAVFATGRAWDQIRTSLAYPEFNVKIVATHSGVTVGPDGATHQALEDIALMRVLPNMTVVVPCDGPQTRDAVLASVKNPGPFYIRLGRAKVPTIEGKGEFKLGKADILSEGGDITIIACGSMVQIAYEAIHSPELKNISCRLINMHTVKPIDSQAIIKAAKETKAIVVAEEHSVNGGLASAVDEVVAENNPTYVLRLGVKNKFGQSGEPHELLQEYNLSTPDVIATVKKAYRFAKAK
ncbi:MAG: transketolase [Candidatus Omnitrophica bacterium CG11_big_fil_rev_8_21_14_0_20_42_13]|uniref:Transketolase n=1 Tax=Candidatus Ghiorseimicrobium undicola TaxID=1974746 RepID=A0A2H0LZJ2_9BACT|nr:MAG: transketolase [Candidatus Omnitrophica bacterium CG11_big_fil_rev_8_21_14_0_20_42_13]